MVDDRQRATALEHDDRRGGDRRDEGGRMKDERKDALRGWSEGEIGDSRGRDLFGMVNVSATIFAVSRASRFHSGGFAGR